MDMSEVYPDVLGDAVSYSSQRLAQLGSLVTAAATMEVRRRARANALKAARGEQELRALREQELAVRQLARAGWAPAHDSRWLAQADLVQAMRVWAAAAGCAGDDLAALSALRKCEERLRELHPYAMAWYDRLRGEGIGAVEAMRQAVPLSGRASHARPGDSAVARQALKGPAEADVVSRRGDAGGVGEPDAGTGHERDLGGWTAARLAAESFPCTAADAAMAAPPEAQAGQAGSRVITARPIRRAGRSL
jgi:hypothetical protein